MGVLGDYEQWVARSHEERSDMKLDLSIRSYDLGAVGQYARKAQELGYDCLWSSETQHDPFLPLAVAATVTSSIKVGTSIAVAFPRSPMILAYTAWDLQKASAGRFILGLGSQVKAHNLRRFSVPFESPGPKLREVILALHAIWECWQNGTPLKFEGQFYKFDLMTPFFNPGPIAHPKIPVYIAGVNQYMCRMAGEVCDGLHVHPFHTPQYLRECVQPAVNEGLQSSRRSRKDFTYATASFVVVGNSEGERARNAAAVKQQIAFYGSTRTYEPVLALHGWKGIAQELHRRSLQGDWTGMASLITDEMLDTFAVSGTYASVGRKLRERYSGLLDRVALYQPYEVELDDRSVVRLAKQLDE
jgi:probable F420-dependent oxidoreductase